MLRTTARAALLALIAVAALLLGATPAVAAPPAPSTDNPAEAAAGWLARQLTGKADDHLVFTGGSFPDVGLTIDAVFAFDAAGVAGDAAARATAFVQANATGYVGFGDERYPGSYAKLLLLAEAQRIAPTSFGGLDLVGLLTASECGAARPECAATPGRYANKTGASSYEVANDFTSPLTQALAILALARSAAADPSPTALTYLLSEACADGGYPGSFTASRAGGTCESDPDVTAFVIQGLYAAGRGADAQPAVAWLAGRQQGNGGFGGRGPTAKSNANSTAVAAQALLVAGQTEAAAKAVDYLLSLQAGCAGRAADRGRIAYDISGSGDPVRATTQAVITLAGTHLAAVSAEGLTASAPVLACDDADDTAASRNADLTHGGTVLAETGAGSERGVLGAGALLLIVGTLVLYAVRRLDSR